MHKFRDTASESHPFPETFSGILPETSPYCKHFVIFCHISYKQSSALQGNCRILPNRPGAE